MPTDKPRITITLEEETYKRIDDYRFSNRITTLSKAINELLKYALDDLESDNSTEQLELDPIEEMEKLKGILDSVHQKMIENRLQSGVDVNVQSMTVQHKEVNKVQIPGRGMRITKDGN